jgi:hypothetical protein
VGQGLQAARSSLLAVLPAVAAESYARAYPVVAKLHMLTEMEEAFALMGRVRLGGGGEFGQGCAHAGLKGRGILVWGGPSGLRVRL